MYCEKCGKQIEDNSKFCDYCGASIANESEQVQPGRIQGESPGQHYPPQQGYAQQQPAPVQQQGYPPPQNTREGITELVLGIISIILSVLIFIQSYLVEFSEAIFNRDSGSGTTGIFVSIFVLVAGIAGIATRKSEDIGGAIAAGVLCISAAIIGFSGAESFSDLNIYAVILLIFGAAFIVAAAIRN
jgi:hypothetical protein